MTEKNQQASDTSDREIVVSRVLNAPRELVFEVWTDPKHIEKWWGPNGFTSKVHEMEVKPGGIWRLTMTGMGMDFPNKIVFHEVVKPERLVYTHGSGQENDPGEFHVTITFDKQGSKTLLTMRSVFKTADARNLVVEKYGAIEGANQTVDRFEKQLAEILAGRSLTISRTLNAPVDLVWQVWTKPEHIRNWWGPTGFTNTIFKMDVKPGGDWEFIMHGPDGKDYRNHSVYKEVVPHERIVFEHFGPNFTATITFTAEGEKTQLNWQMLFESAEQLEQVVKAHGAAEGLKQNLVKLEAYLEKQKAIVSQ